MDISEVSISSLIENIYSKLWNFIYLPTANKSLRKEIESDCGIDWSKHQFMSEDSTINELTARILMAILCVSVHVKS